MTCCAVSTPSIGTFQRLLTCMSSQMRGQDGFGDRSIIATGECALIWLLAGVCSDMNLQITVSCCGVSTPFVRTLETTDFGFFENTVHGRNLIHFECFVFVGILIFDTSARNIIHKEEESRDNNQLLLGSCMQGR